MKIDTALYSNKKRHRQLWYFIVDTILSMSHPAYMPTEIVINHNLNINNLHTCRFYLMQNE